jgi:hypothetical protein
MQSTKRCVLNKNMAMDDVQTLASCTKTRVQTLVTRSSKGALFWSDCNHDCNVSTDSGQTLLQQMSRQSVQRFSVCTPARGRTAPALQVLRRTAEAYRARPWRPSSRPVLAVTHSTTARYPLRCHSQLLVCSIF